MIRALDRATAVRLGRTLSANAYGQLVTILVQLALVPLLLHAWGTRTYGTWLLLSAVPFYLTFSDFGFTTVAKNAMVMATAAGRRDRAVAVFHSIFALLCLTLPLLMAGSVVLVLLLDMGAWLGGGAVPIAAARATLLLLALNVLLYQIFLLVCAGIRSADQPASEATWAATARLGEGAAVALAALAGGGMVAAAAAMVALRLLFLTGAYRWLRARAPWLRLGWSHASRATLATLWYPAFGHAALPVGHALLIQGGVLIVGGVLGPAATILFSTARTVARLGAAGAGMVNNSVSAEFAVLAGAANSAGSDRLFRVHAATTLAMTGIYAVAVLVLGPWIIGWLTHGVVRVVQPFFLLMVGAVGAEMLWSALFTPIAAVNRQQGLAWAYLAVALAAFGAGYPLARQFGVAGVALALVGAHVAMIPLCVRAWRQRAR